MKNHKYLPQKGMGKVHFRSLALKRRLASFYLYENPIFKKVRKTAKNKENPRKSRVFCLASFLSRRIGGATRKSALRYASAGDSNRILTASEPPNSLETHKKRN